MTMPPFPEAAARHPWLVLDCDRLCSTMTWNIRVSLSRSECPEVWVLRDARLLVNDSSIPSTGVRCHANHGGERTR